jgi:hypothetical protein
MEWQYFGPCKIIFAIPIINLGLLEENSELDFNYSLEASHVLRSTLYIQGRNIANLYQSCGHAER